MVKYLIIGLVIASLVGALTLAGNKILDQNTEIAGLTLIVNSQKEAITNAVASATKAAAEFTKLQGKYHASEKGRNDLAEMLSRHDLEKLAKGRPDMLARIINDATKKKLQRFREFGNEEASD